jgi:hypothetical protein
MGFAKPFDWRSVESADYRKYIANLRAIGCPEETIRDIVTGDVNKLYASRAKALILASTNRHEYWKAWGQADPYDAETKQKVKELSKERRAVFKDLIGADEADLTDTWLVENAKQKELSFLPPDKLGQVVDILFDRDRRQRLNEASKAQNLTEAKRIYGEIQAELRNALTPAEWFEYQLRESLTATNLRSGFGDFQPTEEEFRALFRAQQAFDEEFGPVGTAVGATDYAERRQGGLKAVNEQVRNSLGDARGQDYLFEREWASSTLRSIASQFDVSKERYRQVFDVKTAAQDAADRIRGAPALGTSERQARLDAIRAETEDAIGSVLGRDLLPGYIMMAPWLQELNRPGN